jgi:NADH-quinone oxidoreductase subunit G
MPDVSLTIDGVTVSVPAGTNVVDAARIAQSQIPVFCYHPKLPAVGMCRMCLVAVGTPKLDPQTRQPVLDEAGKPVIQMMPKLQTGCTTPVSEGMVVNTVSEDVKFAQKGMLEFLLTSHPLDCPVCDKGGECPLQNLTMGWGPGASRFDYEDKQHFVKPFKLSNLIYLDRERCILCSRCVRFQDDLAGDSVLGFDNRGRNWMIISKSEPGFDSKFSGNTTDICPVGALLNADFRLKARVWELKPVPSLDVHGCAGANITLDMRYEQVMRVMPRENDFVNEIWIADKTRYGARYIESEQRLTTPLVRRGDELQPATWEEALSLIAERLHGVKQSAGAQAIAGLAGDRLSNEELFAFKRLVNDTLGSENLDHRAGAPFEPADDSLAARYGLGLGTNLTSLGEDTAVLVVGADPEEEEPIYLLRLRGIARRGGRLIVANSRPTKLERAPNTTVLRSGYGVEAGVLLALAAALLDEGLVDARAQSLRGFAELRQGLRAVGLPKLASDLGIEEASIREAAKALASAQNRLIVYGREALAAGPQLRAAIEILALLTSAYGKANSGLLAILPAANTRGALDMGFGAGALPASQIWPAARAGQLKALLAVGADPARENPQSADALEALELLVVQDMFLTETARLADVVLPLASIAEQEGTYTNAERRVQRFRQARQPLGMSRSAWEFARDLAQALSERNPAPAMAPARQSARQARANAQAGAPVAVATATDAFDYVTAADVNSALCAALPAYANASFRKLAATGKGGSWGRQVNEAFYYDGTSYENSEGVGLQLPSEVEAGRVQLGIPAIPAQPPRAADKGALRLVPVYVSYYDADPLLAGSLLLDRIAPALARLSSATAARYGLASGARVRLTTARGSLELPALLDDGLEDGLVLAHLGLTAAPIAGLLDGPTTAVSLELVPVEEAGA